MSGNPIQIIKESLTRSAIESAERGWLPDFLLRRGIRRLCAQRLEQEQQRYGTNGEWLRNIVETMSRGPVAIATQTANRQHYEQPAEIFSATLGPRLKYSCCFWPDDVRSLSEAELRALEVTDSRARLSDGMEILDLGCGWGSLTLWLASRYPRCRITAVSNSTTQRRHIETALKQNNYRNVQVVTADINRFDTGSRFDRILSVEMFEHMNNYHELFKRVAGWLKPSGLLFIHVFAHRSFAYRFENEGASDWMAKNFFTAGVMPSQNLLPQFQQDVRLLEQWWWDGEHYRRTAEAWLENMKRNRAELLRVLAATYGSHEAHRWYQRWRMFYLACAELWGFREGKEWGVAHYLFAPRAVVAGTSEIGATA